MSKTNFVAGALVGLVAGLLLAPQKGEDLREDITDAAVLWKKKLSKIAGKTSSQLADLQNMLGDEIEGLNDDVRRRILSIISEETL